MIIPWPAGAGTPDVVGRRLAGRLATALGQPVVPENRSGATGTIGSDAIAKAPPDGYVIGVSNLGSHGVAPAVLRAVPYDPVRDFTHIAIFAEVPLAFAVSATSPFRTWEEVVAAARAQPGAIRVATAGVGTSAHVVLEVLRRRDGLDFTHVPFRGASLAVPEIIAGRIEGTLAGYGEVRDNDRLRIVAQSSEGRIAARPDIASFREAGTDLVSTLWFGLCAPAGLPDPIADRLQQETAAALARPEFTTLLTAVAALPDRGRWRPEVARFVAADVARWGAMARLADVRAD